MDRKKLTPRERYVHGQLVRNGYRVYRHGWPDFLAVKGNEVRLIEVKSTVHVVSRVQTLMHKALAKATGKAVEVIRLDERFSY